MVWGPQGGDRTKPDTDGGSFNMSLVVSGVVMDGEETDA